jgi:hypothetical protein
MAFDWLRNIVLPLLLLVVVITLGYYLLKVREGFTVPAQTPYALAIQNRSLADDAATKTSIASTNVNGFMPYLASFATGIDNATKATQIGTRHESLKLNIAAAKDAITAAKTATTTATSDTTTIAATLATFNNYAAVDLALTGASGVSTTVTALLALLNNASATSSAISDQMLKVNTSITGLMTAMQPLLASAILATGAAANAVTTVAQSAVSAAQSKNTKATAAVNAITQVGTDVGGLLAAINTELAKTTPVATVITTLSNTFGSNLIVTMEKIRDMERDVGNNDTAAAEATTAAVTAATDGVTGFGPSSAGIQTAISSLTTAMATPQASYPTQIAAITAAITAFTTNYNAIKTAVTSAAAATLAAVTSAQAVAASATATAAVTAANTKNTMAAIAVINVATVQADLTSLNATLTLDPKADNLTGTKMATDIPAKLKKLKDNFATMTASINAADDNKGNTDSAAVKTSTALKSSIAAGKTALDALETAIDANKNYLTSVDGSFTSDVVSKARTAVQKAVSDLTGALTNLKINADAAAAAAANAAGVAAATPAATTTAAAAAATTAGTTGTAGAGGAGANTGLGALFSSDFLNTFSDTIMTNSNASVNIDFEYQGDKGKWFDYLSQEHKDAVEAQKAAAAAAAAAAETQNKLLSNMSKATGSKVYYDDKEDCSEDSSPSTQQGCELTNAKKSMKCPTVDTNQYVRKDSVPCWGCDLE